MRSSLVTALACVALAACGDSNPAPNEAEAAQLEAFGFTTSDLTASTNVAYTFAGQLSATGADRDFALAVASDAATLLTADVHSPNGLGLDALDGRVGSVTVFPDWTGSQALVVTASDEAGLAFVANLGGYGGELDALLGADFATFGDELGTARDANYDWSYRAIQFATDDGPVALAPGHAATLTIGGALWRVAAIAAYDRTVLPDGSVSDCGPPDDLLSFEMLRVDADAGPKVQARAEGYDLALGPSCG